MGDWTDRAICNSNADPELFTGEDIVRANTLCNDTIRTFCSQCPVQIECGEWALSEPFFEGIAGGLVWTSHGIRKPFGHTRQRPPAPPPPPTEKEQRKARAAAASAQFAARGWA